MATITFTVDAGAAGAATRTMTVANANVGRILEWSKHRLFGRLDPDTITNEQAIAQWALWLVEQTRAHVQDYERITAEIADIPIA